LMYENLMQIKAGIAYQWIKTFCYVNNPATI
jgi:hypothetical protein